MDIETILLSSLSNTCRKYPSSINSFFYRLSYKRHTLEYCDSSICIEPIQCCISTKILRSLLRQNRKNCLWICSDFSEGPKAEDKWGFWLTTGNEKWISQYNPKIKEQKERERKKKAIGKGPNVKIKNKTLTNG